MATHSNILAWRIPGMEEPGGLQSMGLHRVGHDWCDLAAAAAAAVFHCIYASHLFLRQWRCRLLPCLVYCKQCCNEHWGGCTLSNHVFLPDICLRMGFWGHMVTVFSFLINFHTVSHRRRQWQPTPVLLPGKSYGQRTPWMGSLGVRHNWATSTFAFHFHALEKEMATHSSVPAWRIPGTGEPGRLPSLGLHRFGHDWSDLAAAAAYCFP